MQNTKAASLVGLELIKENHHIDLCEFDNSVNTNRARAKSQDPLHIKQLAQSFETRGWDDGQPLPIAVLGESGRPVLIDGHHRRDAWASLGKISMPVNYYKLTGICSLDDIIVRHGLTANDHLPVRTVSKQDVERAIAAQIEELGPDAPFPTQEEIREMIEKLELKVFTKTQVNQMVSKIYRNTVSSNQIRTLDKNHINAQLNQYPRLNVVDDYIPCTYTNKEDYASRNVIEACDFFNSHGKQKAVGIYALGVDDYQDVIKARERGVEKMEAIFDSFRKAARELPDGVYPWDVQFAFPQIVDLEPEGVPVKQKRD